jgi:hypothetical protein
MRLTGDNAMCTLSQKHATQQSSCVLKDGSNLTKSVPFLLFI